MAIRDLWGGSKWNYAFTDYTNVSPRTTAVWDNTDFPVTLDYHQDTDNDIAAIINSNGTLAFIEVSFQAAIKHNLTTCLQTVGLGVTNSGPICSVTQSITNLLYSSDKYAYNTYGQDTGSKAIVIQIKNNTTESPLLNAMQNHQSIKLWWDSSTSGHGWIGENSAVYLNKVVLASAPKDLRIHYPYDNTLTYNIKPWVALACENEGDIAIPAHFQFSTDNLIWTDLPDANIYRYGSTVLYEGQLPEFTSRGEKQLYFRATSSVGSTPSQGRRITVSDIAPINSGDMILAENHYDPLKQAIQNLQKYYTNYTWFAPSNVQNTPISAQQVADFQLRQFPAQQSINIHKGNKIMAEQHYNQAICNAIKNS